MGGASLEGTNPSHTRGLVRWGNRNVAQRLRINSSPPFYAGGRLAGWRGAWDIPSQLKLKGRGVGTGGSAAPQRPTLSTLNMS